MQRGGGIARVGGGTNACCFDLFVSPPHETRKSTTSILHTGARSSDVHELPPRGGGVICSLRGCPRGLLARSALWQENCFLFVPTSCLQGPVAAT